MHLNTASPAVRPHARAEHTATTSLKIFGAHFSSETTFPVPGSSEPPRGALNNPKQLPRQLRASQKRSKQLRNSLSGCAPARARRAHRHKVVKKSRGAHFWCIYTPQNENDRRLSACRHPSGQLETASGQLTDLSVQLYTPQIPLRTTFLCGILVFPRQIPCNKFTFI